MNPDEPFLSPVAWFFLFWVTLGGGVFFFRRWRAWDNRIKSWDPVRPAPWGGVDVSFLFLLLFSLEIAAGVIFPPPDVSTSDIAGVTSSAHAVEQFLTQSFNIENLLLCFFSVVLLAPVVEELFFRVLLQGYLEARETSWREQFPILAEFPLGWLPLFLPAIFFAVLHARFSDTPISSDAILWMLTISAGSRLVTLVCVVLWLKFKVHATLADFGFRRERLKGHVHLGLCFFFSIIGGLLALQAGLRQFFFWLQSSRGIVIPFAPDPIPLLFLALVLGFMYRRTRSIVPIAVLHAALNGTSLLLLLLHNFLDT